MSLIALCVIRAVTSIPVFVSTARNSGLVVLAAKSQDVLLVEMVGTSQRQILVPHAPLWLAVISVNVILIWVAKLANLDTIYQMGVATSAKVRWPDAQLAPTNKRAQAAQAAG